MVINYNMCLVYSEFDRLSNRSKKNDCGGRRRRRHRPHHQGRRHQEENQHFLRQFVIQQNAELREKIEAQQLEMNELKTQIEKFRDLAKKIDDELEWVVHGVCRVQHHLEEVDCQRRRIEMAINDVPM